MADDQFLGTLRYLKYHDNEHEVSDTGIVQASVAGSCVSFSEKVMLLKI